MTTHTSKGIPVPEDIDSFDVPGDLAALAAWLDDRPGVAAVTTAQRNALAGAEVWQGRVIYNLTTSLLEVNTTGGSGSGAWTAATLGAVLSINTTKTPDSAGNLVLAATDVGAAASTLGAAEKVAALSATTGTATANCANASVFTVGPTGNITIAASNVPAAGTACTLTIIISQGATVRTVAMPAGTVWLGPAPGQVANKMCVITMMTTDGGTTWLATGAVQP